MNPRILAAALLGLAAAPRNFAEAEPVRLPPGYRAVGFASSPGLYMPACRDAR